MTSWKSSLQARALICDQISEASVKLHPLSRGHTGVARTLALLAALAPGVIVSPAHASTDEAGRTEDEVEDHDLGRQHLNSPAQHSAAPAAEESQAIQEPLASAVRSELPSPNSRNDGLSTLPPLGRTHEKLVTVGLDSLLDVTFRQRVVPAAVDAPKFPFERSQKFDAGVLPFGASRQARLAAGPVAAPGLPDFASYLRANGRMKPGSDDDELRPLSVRPGGLPKDALAEQAKVNQLRLKTTEGLRSLLAAKGSGAPAEAARIDLLLRLARLEIERADFLFEVEARRFQDAHDHWRQASEKGARESTEPQFRPESARAALLASIEALRTATTQFPTSPRAAEALYLLGFALSQAGDDNATLHLERLLKLYPQAPEVSLTLLTLGEHHFSKGRYDKAVSSYQRVLDQRDPIDSAYALYKLGWSHFELAKSERAKQGSHTAQGKGDTDKNLDKSLAAFKMMTRQKEGASEAVRVLRHEARGDMVLVYAEKSEALADAQKVLSVEGKERALYVTLLERMAWAQTEAGNDRRAVTLYERLVSEAGPSADLPRLPRYFSQEGDLLETLKDADSATRLFQNAARILAPGGEWTKRFSQDAVASAARARLLDGDLMARALRFHAEAVRTSSEPLFKNAEALYQIHASLHAETSEAYASTFYHAELLARRGQMKEALDDYLKVAALDERFRLKGKWTHTALLDALICADTLIAEKAPGTQAKLPVLARADQPTALSPVHQKLVTALDSFVRLFPSDKLAQAFASRAAAVSFAYGAYPDARSRVQALSVQGGLQAAATKGVAANVARLLLRVSLERKDWDSAISESRRFLKVAPTTGTDATSPGAVAFRADLVNVLKGAKYQRALVLEKQSKRLDAAVEFDSFQKEFPADIDAPRALFNAANDLFRVGRMDEAIARLRLLVTASPSSDLVPQAHFLIGSNLDATGQYKESAKSYEASFASAPQSVYALESCVRASEVRFAQGEMEKAASVAKECVGSSPNVSGRTLQRLGRAWLVLGRSQKAKGDAATATVSFGKGAQILSAGGSTGGGTAILLFGLAADTALQTKEPEAAARWTKAGLGAYDAARAFLKHNGEASEGLRLMGHAQLALLEPQRESLMSRRIVKGEDVTAEFARLRDDAQSLAQRYLALSKSENAETSVEALYHVAELQEALANALLAAPEPKGARQADVSQYRSMIERLALPLQEEAANLYWTALQRATETEAITPVTQKLNDKLALLRPSDFHRVAERMPQPGYQSAGLAATDETRGLLKD